MNTVICGAGEVGRHAAEVFAGAGDNVTIIDLREPALERIEESMDVRTLQGSGTHADTLREAGCERADLFIAATHTDEVNLLAASIAKGLGVRRCVARVHHAAYYEQRGLDLQQHFGIDHLLCPEQATAAAIAQSLRNPGALAVETFARGKIEMQQLAVTEHAPVVEQALSKIPLPRAVRIGAVETEQAAFIPDGRTVLRPGNIVTLIGEGNTIEKARKLFTTETFRRRRVVVIGSSSLAVWLARALHSRVFTVRMLVADRGRAEELASKLDWITVVHSDPSDPTVLEQERIDQADAVVAVSDDDEENILTAAHAKTLGVPMAMAVLQRSTYLHLTQHVGIDRSFSPRITAVSQLRHLINEEPIRKLASLTEGIADVYEVRVPNEAPAIGQSLRDVAFPPRTLVAAIVHQGDEVRVPGAEDKIAAGDTAVVIAPADARKQLAKLFGLR